MPTENDIVLQDPAKPYSVITSFRAAIPIRIQPKPAYISLSLPEEAFRTEYGGGPPGINKFCDAVMFYRDLSSPSILFCRGCDAYNFNLLTGELKEPVPIAGFFGGSLPIEFQRGVTSLLWGGDKYIDLLYFFRDNIVGRFNRAVGCFDVLPSPISWPAAQQTWLGQGPDVALHAIEPEFRTMSHFFKGPEYLRVNLEGGVVDHGPVTIAEQFGLPEPFSKGIDAAFYGASPQGHVIYFVTGDRFITYDTRRKTVASGARFILEKWPNLAILFPRPQLFLAEQYELLSIREGLIEDSLVPGPPPPPIGPNTVQTIRLAVKHTSSSDVTSSSTVLDSQNAVLVDNLNESMKKESENEGSSERYDYKLDASTVGKVTWDVGAVDWTANFDLKGGTNDERKRFSATAKKAVDKQVQQTAAASHQSVRQVTENYHSTDANESVMEQKIENPSNAARSFVLWRLSESVRMLVALRDIEIVFSNGDEFRRAALGNLRDLLDRYLDEEKTKKAVESAICKELQRIQDCNGRPVSCLEIRNDGTIAFDRGVKSMCKVNGSEKEVEGIVTASESFTRLTDAVILKVIESPPASF